jgi:hypothetical protein
MAYTLKRTILLKGFHNYHTFCVYFSERSLMVDVSFQWTFLYKGFNDQWTFFQNILVISQSQHFQIAYWALLCNENTFAMDISTYP